MNTLIAVVGILSLLTGAAMLWGFGGTLMCFGFILCLDSIAGHYIQQINK